MKGSKLRELFSKLKSNKEFYKNNFAKIKSSTTSLYNACFFIKILSSNENNVYPALITKSIFVNYCLINNNWQFNIVFENSKEKKNHFSSFQKKSLF